jgi:mono/diheme cytochrome c family protein
VNFDPTAIPDLIGRFHPLMLHFPIGLLMWAAVVELVEVIKRRSISSAGPVSLPLVIPGAAAAVLASLSGWWLANPEDPDSALAWHRWLGVSTTVLALLTAGVGVAVVRGRIAKSNTYRAALFLCVPVLAVGGHIGGELKWGEGFIEKGLEKVFFANPTAEDGPPGGSLAQASIDVPQEQLGLRLYHQQVRATLDNHCVKCHGPDKTKGKLRLDLPDDIKDPTRETPVMIPGDPDSSLLVELLLLPADDEDRMPPLEEPALTDEQRRGIVEWVRAGAPWPAEDGLAEDGQNGVVGVAGEVGAAGELGAAGSTVPPAPQPDESADDPADDADDDPADEPVEAETDQVDASEAVYLADVQPVLESHCYECHGTEKQKGDLRLDLREVVFGEREFPTIIVGDASDSELILRVSLPDEDEDRMPPDGDRLTEEEIAAISKWIDEGAGWPETKPIEIQPSDAGVGPPTARARTPGQLPDMPSITIEDEAILESIASCVTKLRSEGVRVAPISRTDDSHEAVFRLLRKDANDKMLEGLRGLEPVLTRLDLAGTSVTGESIRDLWRFGNLRVLNLSETSVTDDDVAVLASLPDLTVLNLFGTQVTDDCLMLLERMPSLRRVYLWRTEVTFDGASRLSSSRPEMLVDNGVAPSPVPLKAPVKVESSGAWLGRDDIADAHVHDGSVDTIWAVPEQDRSGWIKLTLEKPHRIVGVRLDEGAFPRIRKFSIEVLKGIDWVEVASGTTIGSSKTVLFDALEAQDFRLQITEAIETPVIAEFDLLIN